MTDLTDHNANDSLAALIDAVDDYAIFMLDPRGGVVTWNAGARRIKGYTDDEIVGRHFSAFFENDDVSAGKPQQLLTEAAAAGRAADEGWRVRRDGSRFWANVVITALFDDNGDVRGFIKVTRDETERRTAEERARQLEALVERETLARDLNRAVINRVFGAGLALENVRKRLDDASMHDLIDQAVAELDQAISELRMILFHFSGGDEPD